MEENNGKDIFMKEYEQFKIDQISGEKQMYDHYNDEDTYYSHAGQLKMLDAGRKIRLYDHFMELFPDIFK